MNQTTKVQDVATVRIYSKYKSTKKQENGEKVTTMGERVHYSTTYAFAKSNMKLKTKLDQVVYFASRVIGLRVKAILGLGKTMPSTIYFELSFGGRVFRTEGILVDANMTRTVALSMKALSKLKPEDVASTVQASQLNGLRAAAGFLNDVRQAAKEAAAIKDTADTLIFQALNVTPEQEEVIDTEATPVQ